MRVNQIFVSGLDGGSSELVKKRLSSGWAGLGWTLSDALRGTIDFFGLINYMKRHAGVQ